MARTENLRWEHRILAGLEIERVRPYIERALEHAPPTHTVQDVLDGIQRGEFQCWPGEHSLMVTQIQVYPRRKCLCFYLAAGHQDELRQMLPSVLQWAREHGCASAFLAGRPGWARSFLKADGWRTTQLIMEREL